MFLLLKDIKKPIFNILTFSISNQCVNTRPLPKWPLAVLDTPQHEENESEMKFRFMHFYGWFW